MRRLAAAGVVAVMMGACSSTVGDANANQLSSDEVAEDSSTDNGEIVEIDEEGIVEAGEATLSVSNTDVDVDAAVATYQIFLADADAAMMGDEDALSRAQSATSALAETQLMIRVDQFETMRSVAGLDVTIERVSHIQRATADSSGIVTIRDCVEELQEEESGTVTPVRFASQISTLAETDFGWQVQGFVEVDAGVGTEGDPYGCLPTDFRDRLSVVVEDFFVVVADAERDPDLDLTSLLGDQVADELVAQLNSELGVAPRERSVVTPMQARLVGGVSDGTVDGYAAEMAICIRYPQGKIWAWEDDGEQVVETPFVAPSEGSISVRILSERVDDGFVDEIVEISGPSIGSCWAKGEIFRPELAWG